MPAFLRWFKANNPFDKEQQLKKKANQTDIKLPMEEQLEFEAPKEMVVYYEEIVIQFGYIAMFGSSFPLVGVISLVFSRVLFFLVHDSGWVLLPVFMRNLVVLV